MKATPLKKMTPDQLVEVVRKNRVAMMMATTDREFKLAQRRRATALRLYYIAIVDPRKT